MICYHFLAWLEYKLLRKRTYKRFMEFQGLEFKLVWIYKSRELRLEGPHIIIVWPPLPSIYSLNNLLLLIPKFLHSKIKIQQDIGTCYCNCFLNIYISFGYHTWNYYCFWLHWLQKLIGNYSVDILINYCLFFGGLP